MPHSYQELIVILFCIFSLFIIGAGFSARSPKDICAVNIKNIYSMTISYQQDYGSLPPVITRIKPYWKFWYENLRKYTESDLVFCCPADKRNSFMFEKQSPLFNTKRIKVPSYGMNYFLGGKPGSRPFKIKNIKKPDKLFFMEKVKYLICALLSSQINMPHSGMNEEPIIFLPTAILNLSKRINCSKPKQTAKKRRTFLTGLKINRQYSCPN